MHDREASALLGYTPSYRTTVEDRLERRNRQSLSPLTIEEEEGEEGEGSSAAEAGSENEEENRSEEAALFSEGFPSPELTDMAPRRPRFSVPSLLGVSEGDLQPKVVGQTSAPKRGRSAPSEQEAVRRKRQCLEPEKGKEVEEAQGSEEPELWRPALTYRKRTVRATDRICQSADVACAAGQALMLPRDLADLESSGETALLKGAVQDSAAVSNCFRSIFPVRLVVFFLSFSTRLTAFAFFFLLRVSSRC